VLVLVATALMPGLLSRTGGQLRTLMHRAVDVAGRPDPGLLPGLVGDALLAAVWAVLPLLLGTMVLAVAGNLAQVGFLLTSKPLKPDFKRLNPISGFRQMFSAKGLWQMSAALLRLGLITAIVWVSVRGIAVEVAQGSLRSPSDSVALIGSVAMGLIRTVAAVCVVIAIGDYAVKRRSHERDLRMTRAEVKREAKDTEGDPHLRARLRSMGMAISRNRMIGAVATADVVITNPTHLAIAIAYRRAEGAPKVVARGADVLAARIRREADRAGVPCVESKPLAQVLYRVCRPGEEIPTELYQAVATVLAFLHRLGPAHRSLAGRLSLPVPDTWSPEGGQLDRVPPRRRARRIPHQSGSAADGNDQTMRPEGQGR
jgi:flagellar biosynthetic protein FlhB